MPGTAGVPGKPGQLVSMQTSFMAKKISSAANKTHCNPTLPGWWNLYREKKEVLDIRGHLVYEESLYVCKYS